MRLFEFDVHIGDWRVLVQSSDIKNGAIQSRHITDNSVTTEKIGDGQVKSRNIDTEAVTTDKIGNGEIKSRNIAYGAVTPDKIQDRSITGDDMPPGAIPNGKLANDAVQTRNIKARNVTAEKLALSLIQSEHLNPVVIQYITKDVQNQIDSLQIHGLAVSNEFGTDSHIGVSQKTLTEAINRIYTLLEEALGRTLLGFTWTVTPDYFISEGSENITIVVNPINQGEILEHVSLKVNGVEVATADNVDTFSHEVTLSDTATIRVDAQVLGVPYYREQVVQHYNSFFLGAGTAYTDVLNVQHVIPIANNMRGAYDVTAADGDHLFVIVGDTLAEGFIRADINGVEIPFTESTITSEGKTYKVFTSENTYSAGTYNIDING